MGNLQEGHRTRALVRLSHVNIISSVSVTKPCAAEEALTGYAAKRRLAVPTLLGRLGRSKGGLKQYMERIALHVLFQVCSPGSHGRARNWYRNAHLRIIACFSDLSHLPSDPAACRLGDRCVRGGGQVQTRVWGVNLAWRERRVQECRAEHVQAPS